MGLFTKRTALRQPVTTDHDAVAVAVTDQLQAMSERLEEEITAAVRTILERSGYFHEDGLDQLVKPVASWACGLPWEAYDSGYVIISDEP